MPPRRSARQPIVKAAAFSLLAMFALIGLTHDGNAQEVVKKTEVKKKAVPTLEGSWSGGGSVSFASGSREQARCRAQYHRAGNNSYTVNATCATASGRAAQTATVRQVGENRYSGSFYNSEYSISGVMHVVVHGSRQTVRLISSSASAVLSMSR
jgi:hypothetical protein